MIQHVLRAADIEDPTLVDEEEVRESPFWDWEFAFHALPDMLMAFLKVTLVVTVVGTLIAAVLGLVIAILMRVLPRPLAWVVKWMANFIRMTPLVVQLIFMFWTFMWLDGMTIGIIVFGVHYATYMSEVYRAGIESVPKGQWEATTALSMSAARTWRRVVIPQALRSTVPSLGNYAISMFKDTPFLIVISVAEMVTVAGQIGAPTFRYTEVFVLAGLIFLAASYPTALLISRLEKRLAYAH
ncbi:MULTISPECIES: ectoine/hydroxyectoine ABC transporter permease subunit EhuD [Actinomycetes]|uniref:Ectoine/hydroxyectoine ABC transporter permease subunit EhuD n=2 Tax=Actinomycetes TaxID=1760 RepID=A0ABP6M4Z2_9MICC|nr:MULTISPECIES: ectoine/hydroxyectoine ABC transporter permease subunit EhuD [unclassified Nesterenkonia]MDS2173133.1 ectoine/hydroxyectoine ABC transporter permease subunit EhuD [Nesterenkonia sp. CL21]OSM42475.1 ectoine/hydroxyectoine ABC transporter permease subunit EhuD [Nesterenkonia sp. PF2B19]